MSDPTLPMGAYVLSLVTTYTCIRTWGHTQLLTLAYIHMRVRMLENIRKLDSK